MSLQDEMERVGRIVAGDQGLKVHIRGVDAFATPGEVTIPALEQWGMLGPNAKRMLHGLLDHETAHAHWTDFEVFAAARGDAKAMGYVRSKYHIHADLVRRIEKLNRDLLGFTLNAVEDAWIERKQGELWPGCRVNLFQKNTWFWAEGSAKCPSVRERLKTDSSIAAFLLAFSSVARKTIALEDLSSYDIYPAVKACEADFRAIDLCESSFTALEIAVGIVERIHSESDEEPGKGKSEKGKDKDGEDDESVEGDEEENEEESEEDEDGEDERDDNSDENEDGTSDSEEDDEADGDEDSSEDGEGDDDDASEGEDESETEDENEDESGDSTSGRGKGESEEESEGDESEGASKEGGKNESSGAPIEIEGEIDALSKEGRPLTPEDRINAEIKAALFDGPPNDLPYVVFSHEFDLERDLSSMNAICSAAWNQIEKDAYTSVGPLISAFEAALRARRDKRAVSGNDEGVVDPNLLAGYSLGAVRPDEMYEQYVAEDDRDCAVALLVDCSGSMQSASKSGSKSHVAQRAVAAFHLALNSVQVPHEICGFTCVATGAAREHEWFCQDAIDVANVEHAFERCQGLLLAARARGVEIDKFARIVYGGYYGNDDFNMLVPTYGVFKSFGSDDPRAIARITGVHENLDGEAVLWQARRLALRPERRKVMFVFSDGEPAGSRDIDQGQRYLREAVKRTVEAGIEVIGIGVCSSAVQNYYPKNIVVYNLVNLPSIVLSTLTEVIMSSRQEGDGACLSP